MQSTLQSVEDCYKEQDCNKADDSPRGLSHYILPSYVNIYGNIHTKSNLSKHRQHLCIRGSIFVRRFYLGCRPDFAGAHPSGAVVGKEVCQIQKNG